MAIHTFKRIVYTEQFYFFSFFTTLLLINLPFLYSYSQTFDITLAKFTCDEHVFLENISLIIDCALKGRPLWAGYNLYSLGYGSVYWGVSALIALPAWLMKSEQGMILSLRFSSLCFSLGAFYFIANMAQHIVRNYLITFTSIALCFFTPIVINYSNMIHPEAMYVFFMAAAFYCISKDNGTFGKYYYSSLAASALAVGTKILALPFGLVFLIYFAHSKRSLAQLKKIIATSAAFWFGCFAVINSFLLFPMIRTRYLNWVFAVSNTVRNGHPGSMPNPLINKLFYFSHNYVSLALFVSILVLTSFAITRYKKHFMTIFSATGLTFFFFCFSVFYAYEPYHYGIALIYFFPLCLGLCMHYVITKFSTHAMKTSQTLLLLVLLITGSKQTLNSSLNQLTHPTTMGADKAVAQKMNHVHQVLAQYLSPAIKKVGHTPYLALKHFNGNQFEKLRPESFSAVIASYDLLVLWKHDDFYQPLTNTLAQNITRHRKCYEDDDVVLYKS